MESKRLYAAILTALGLLLLTAAFLTPGEPHLVPAGLPSEDHVTALAAGEDGSLLAATQGGEVWQYRDRLWTRERIDPEGRVITALVGEPEHHPVGTASGLWWQGGPSLPARPGAQPRVLDILETTDGPVLATGDGLRILADGRWHEAMPGLFAYRLQDQTRDGEQHLHVGTIGDGVYSVAAEQRLEAWAANRQGLPEEVKVLSFAVTAGARLLAGTDQGLFWQAAPGRAWQPLGADLGAQRILALYAAPAQKAGEQRLWLGTDDGLSTLDLSEYPERLEARAPARRVAEVDEAAGIGISWIVPHEAGVAVSAGTVYLLRDVRSPIWPLMMLGGLVLVALGAWFGLRSRARAAG